MSKLICVLLVAVTFLAFVLGSWSDDKTGKRLNHNSDRFTVLKEEDGEHRVVVDNESGYEYFVTTTYGGSYVIGGNVLDNDGHPKKYVK